MSKIKLDKRLSSVASMVKKGSVVADIGTDHAYLLCYLLENGICERGIAADLRKGPLENARQTVIASGLSEKVELVLSNGLENIKENSCDTIVIAGMGGILIAEILEKAPWVKNKNIHIIVQPMSHSETLREYFVKNGFEILQEKTSTDSKHYYCAISAIYNGEFKEKTTAYYYLGELLLNGDETTKIYIEKMLTSLKKRNDALIKCGKEDVFLNETVKEIEQKIKETALW